jgi:hypothetical protein
MWRYASCRRRAQEAAEAAPVIPHPTPQSLDAFATGMKTVKKICTTGSQKFNLTSIRNEPTGQKLHRSGGLILEVKIFC